MFSERIAPFVLYKRRFLICFHKLPVRSVFLIQVMDYVYLVDNARSPYGTRSFEVVYQFTRQAVLRLFESGCQLVILACNTASAKALRTIQQKDLPTWDPNRRVLGVIRPTVELVDTISRTKHIGIVGTSGTITPHVGPFGGE